MLIASHAHDIHMFAHMILTYICTLTIRVSNVKSASSLSRGKGIGILILLGADNESVFIYTLSSSKPESSVVERAVLW